jgi:hypothetical protein
MGHLHRARLFVDAKAERADGAFSRTPEGGW